jgi:hypothetical protein
MDPDTLLKLGASIGTVTAFLIGLNKLTAIDLNTPVTMGRRKAKPQNGRKNNQKR